MNYDTTRRHPRTLSEAFASDRAHCIEGPDRKRTGKLAFNWFLVVAIWALIVLLSSGGLK